jgi:hypothetical protein
MHALNVLFTCSIIIKPIAILLYSISESVADQILMQSPISIWFGLNILYWFCYSSLRLWKKDIICKFLQSGCVQYVLNVLFIFSIIKGLPCKPIAILLLLDFWVSCGSNSDAKPDFDFIWAEYSVILLFFSKTMKKRPYLQVFAIWLCICIKCFVYMQCMYASAIFSALAKNHAFNHFYIIYFMHERLKRLWFQ